MYFGAWWRLIFLLIFLYLVVLLSLIIRVKYPAKNITDHKYKIGLRDLINPIVIFGSIALLFHNGVILTVGIWLTTYLSFFKLDLSYGSAVVAFYWLSVMFGRMLTQKMIQIIDEKLFLILISIFSTFSLIIMAFINNLIVKALSIIFLGISIGGMFPLLLSIVFSTNPKIVGRIFSILGLVGYGSTMIFQLITGLIAENYGEGSVIYIPLINSVLCIIFVLLLVRSNKIFDFFKKNKENKITTGNLPDKF